MKKSKFSLGYSHREEKKVATRFAAHGATKLHMYGCLFIFREHIFLFTLYSTFTIEPIVPRKWYVIKWRMEWELVIPERTTDMCTWNKNMLSLIVTFLSKSIVWTEVPWVTCNSFFKLSKIMTQPQKSSRRWQHVQFQTEANDCLRSKKYISLCSWENYEGAKGHRYVTKWSFQIQRKAALF